MSVRTVVSTNELVIPLRNGAALVASNSDPGLWHCVKVVDGAQRCDCKGYVNRGNCRHVKAVQALGDLSAREEVEKIRALSAAELHRTTAPLADYGYTA